MLDLLAQVWSTILVAALLHVGGVMGQDFAARKGWRTPSDPGAKKTWFDISLPAHPIFFSVLLALIPFRIPNFLGDTWLAREGYFCLIGVFYGQIYEAIRNILDGVDDIVLEKLRLITGTAPREERHGNGGGEA